MHLLHATTAARDRRGALHVLAATEHAWRELCRIETNAGALRGNHYHAHATELLFVLRGRVRLVVLELGSARPTFDGELSAGAGVVLLPGEAHALVALEATELLSARTTPFAADDPDLHPCPVLTP